MFLFNLDQAIAGLMRKKDGRADDDQPQGSGWWTNACFILAVLSPAVDLQKTFLDGYFDLPGSRSERRLHFFHESVKIRPYCRLFGENLDVRLSDRR